MRRPVEHRNFENDRQSYMSCENGKAKNARLFDGLDTPKGKPNVAIEKVTKPMPENGFTYNVCNEGGCIQSQKILSMAIMTEANKNSGLGVYI